LQRKRNVLIWLFLLLSFQVGAFAGEIFQTESFSEQAFGDVSELAISDDRQTAVFISSQIPGDIEHIYAMNVDDGVSRNLSGTLILETGVVQTRVPVQFQPGYLISPDSQNVLFFAREPVSTDIGLYLSPLDGSAAAVRISGQQAVGTNAISARFASDGTKLAYVLDIGAATHDLELNVISIDGQVPNIDFEGSNLLLSGTLGFDEYVLELYKFSANGSYLVYGDAEKLNSIEFVDDATPSFLRGTISPSSFFSIIQTDSFFQILSTNDRVVFLLEEGVAPNGIDSGESNLYSIGIDGTGLIQLNDRQSDEENVYEFFVLENPNKVVFRGFHAASAREEVFSADPDTAASEIVISNVIPLNQDLSRVLAPEVGSKAVFFSREVGGSPGSLWSYDASTDSVTEMTRVTESNAWQFVAEIYNFVFVRSSKSSALWFATVVVSGTGGGSDFNLFYLDLDNTLPPLLLGRLVTPGELSLTDSRRPEEYAINYVGNILDLSTYDFNFQEIIITDIAARNSFQIPLPFGVPGVLFGSSFGSSGFVSSGVVDNDTVLFPYGDPDLFTMRFYISKRVEMDSETCFPIFPLNKKPVVFCL